MSSNYTSNPCCHCHFSMDVVPSLVLHRREATNDRSLFSTAPYLPCLRLNNWCRLAASAKWGMRSQGRAVWTRVGSGLGCARIDQRFAACQREEGGFLQVAGLPLCEFLGLEKDAACHKQHPGYVLRPTAPRASALIVPTPPLCLGRCCSLNYTTPRRHQPSVCCCQYE